MKKILRSDSLFEGFVQFEFGGSMLTNSNMDTRARHKHRAEY